MMIERQPYLVRRERIGVSLASCSGDELAIAQNCYDERPRGGLPGQEISVRVPLPGDQAYMHPTDPVGRGGALRDDRKGLHRRVFLRSHSSIHLSSAEKQSPYASLRREGSSQRLQAL